MRLPLILVVALLVLGGLWWALRPAGSEPTAPAPAATTAAFTLTLDPAVAGARLWLGPQEAVALPATGRLTLTDLPPGDHDLVVQAPGYQTYTTRVTVPAGAGAYTVHLVVARGSLRIEAQPTTRVTVTDVSGATRELGTADREGALELADVLPVGTYTVTLRHNDHEPLVLTDVTLPAHELLTLTAPQRPLPAALRVEALPRGARVLLNGELVGETPLDLPAVPSREVIEVAVELDGHVTATRQLTLQPRETTTVNLGRLEVERGVIALRLTPGDLRWEDVRIEVDGRGLRAERREDAWWLEHLPMGRRGISVSHPEYETWRQDVMVTDTSPVPVPVTLREKPARIEFYGAPPDYQITLGDRVLASPDDYLHLPGRQTVTLSATAPRHFPATREFTLRPGVTEEWNLDLERRREPYPTEPHENSLGMRFVPMADSTLLFAVWETRERDFAAFATANGREWNNAGAGSTHPAVNVTWHDARAFCEWLTTRERASGWLKPHQRYRLPTDREWSLAVDLPHEEGDTPAKRHGAIRDHYPWGRAWIPHGSGNYHQEWDLDFYERTAPVGSFLRNVNGLYDLGGNVWEWVEDAWDHGSELRTLRGGSFFYPPPDKLLPNPYRYYDMTVLILDEERLLSSVRFLHRPDRPRHDIGFRVVLEVE
jgi:hypothetical protein